MEYQDAKKENFENCLNVLIGDPQVNLIFVSFLQIHAP